MRFPIKAALTITILFLIIVTVVAWFLLPRLISSLPGQMSGRLPESLLSMVTTPLPTALPVPAGAARTEIDSVAIPEFTPARSDAPLTPSLEISLPTTTLTIQKVGADTAEETRRSTLTPVMKSTPTVTPELLPRRSEINGLEVIPQKFNNCGPANLTMSLNFHGHPLDQLEIGGFVKPNYDDRNVSPDELVDYVNRETPLRANWFSGGSLVLLKRLLAAGYPVIVEKGLFLNEEQGWMGHYLTIYGYDDIEQEFLSHDSFLGPWDNSGRPVNYEALEKQWSQFNYLFMLVYRPEQADEVEELLGPDLIERELMWQRAVMKSTALTTAEPSNAYAWFNLGTSLTYLGEITGDDSLFISASAAFDEAFTIGLPWRMLWYQFKPYVAYLATGRFEDVLSLTEAILSNVGGQNVEETYLYRGHALAAKERFSEATTAYQRVLKLKPSYEQAQQSIDQLAELD